MTEARSSGRRWRWSRRCTRRVGPPSRSDISCVPSVDTADSHRDDRLTADTGDCSRPAVLVHTTTHTVHTQLPPTHSPPDQGRCIYSMRSQETLHLFVGVSWPVASGLDCSALRTAYWVRKVLYPLHLLWPIVQDGPVRKKPNVSIRATFTTNLSLDFFFYDSENPMSPHTHTFCSFNFKRQLLILLLLRVFI